MLGKTLSFRDFQEPSISREKGQYTGKCTLMCLWGLLVLGQSQLLCIPLCCPTTHSEQQDPSMKIFVMANYITLSRTLTYSMDNALFRQVVHPHCYINHIFNQLFGASFIDLNSELQIKKLLCKITNLIFI